MTAARRQEAGGRSANVSRFGRPRATARTMSRRIASVATASIAVEYLKKVSLGRLPNRPEMRAA